MTLPTNHTPLLSLITVLVSLICSSGCFIEHDDPEPGPNPPPSQPSTSLSGAISEAQTWRGRLEVTGDVTVRSGANITIEPGTIIELCVDCSIEFGWNSGVVTVKANGTEEAPIIFRGKTQQAGFWSRVSFGRNVTSDSSLTHTRFEHGGAAGSAAAVLLDGPVRLNHVSVTESGAAGLQASTFAPGSEGLSVDRVATHPVHLTGEQALANYPAGGGFDAATLVAGTPTVLIDLSRITINTTMRDLGIPYQLNDTLQVRTTGTELTLEAGVEIIGQVDKFLDVGWNSSAVTFLVKGTADKPVIMRGPSTTPGAWGGLKINGNVTSSSRVERLIVRDAGGGVAAGEGVAVSVDAPIVLTSLTVEGAQDRGVIISSAGLGAGSDDLTVRATRGYPLEVDMSALTQHFSGDFTFEENTTQRVLVTGTRDIERTGTLINPGIPYEIAQELALRGEHTLTIEPGTIFEFRADTLGEFGWNSSSSTIIARGTASAPIIFRGLAPTPGYWKGLYVRRNVRSSSALEHVHVLHGGGVDGEANLTLDSAAPVSNSRFANSSGYGVRIPRGVSASYMLGAGNTFEANAKGDLDDQR